MKSPFLGHSYTLNHNIRHLHIETIRKNPFQFRKSPRDIDHDMYILHFRKCHHFDMDLGHMDHFPHQKKYKIQHLAYHHQYL